MSRKNKKRQETIRFIESIVYIVLIIVTIMANTYGNIYIKLIPTLFILGIIGRVIYTRPVITCLFGSIFSIITMYINGTYTINEILVGSLTTLILIALGEIFGICYMVTYKSLKSKLDLSSKIKNIVITLLFLILSICLIFYMNGDVVTYKKAEKKILNYLSSTYEDLSFEVDGYRYVPFVDSAYLFKVKNNQNDSTYKFVVYKNENLKIYDEYKNNTIKLNNDNINKFITNNINENADISISAEYVMYNKCRVNIKYKTNDSKTYQDNLSENIVKIIEKFKLYTRYEDIYEIQVVVENLEGKNINIILIDKFDYDKECSNGNEINYIKDILKVEFFDF